MSQAISKTTTAQITYGDIYALLTFKVAEQVYALPVTHVVRIIEMVTITQLPDSPDMIQGIINLQGKAVPVMDMRHRFGLSKKEYGLHTPIILADMGKERMLGLVVDAVEDVLEVPAADLEITETIMPAGMADRMASQAGHLASVAKIDRQMILVLNVKALLSATEHIELSQALGDEVPANNKEGSNHQ
jgi:purine-binding chemotaxis protein CheW